MRLDRVHDQSYLDSYFSARAKVTEEIQQFFLDYK